MAPKSTGGARQRVARSVANSVARSRSPPVSDALSAASSGLPARGGARQRALASLPVVPDEPPAADSGTDFRKYVSNLFLKNRFSGAETVKLLGKAHKAGICAVSDLASSGGGGAQMQNATRDLMSKLLRSCDMPELYLADIELYNTSSDKMESCPLPFLLPHEVQHSGESS